VSGHSPGPWRQLDVERIVDPGGFVVARVSGQILDGSYEANGRLIAAAPAMRDLLERLLAEAPLSVGDQAEIAVLLGGIDGG
jgi:hypothetical protein